MKTNKVKQQTQAGSAGLIQRAMVPIRTLTFLILAGQILPPGMPSAQAAEILSQALGSEVAVVNADAPVQSDLSLAAKPTASKTSTDFLVVRTLSGTLSPSGGSDAYDPSRLTKLPGEPILRAGTVGDNASKINLIQNSTRKFSLDFKANQAGDAAFAFALFSSPADLSNGLTMAVGGSAGNKVTLEIRDWNYKLYSKEIELTGTMQNYTLQLTGSHLPAGFDGAQIREIVWVVKSTQTIQVETVDLKYEQTIAGGDYDGAALTELPRDLQYFSGAGDGNSAPNASADLKSIAPGVLKFDYVLPDPQDFAFSGVRFDSARPLGDKFVVALTGPQGKTAFLEIKDDAGKVHRVSLLMTGVRRNYVINLNRDTVYSAFQLDKIREIVFVADYSTGKSGSLQIETLAPGGTPVNGGAIEGSTYDASRLSTLPGSPTMGDGANNAYQLMNKISNREFSLDYRLKEPSDSSFALAWAQFATPQNLSAGVTFAAKGSVKGQVKVEFKDANGNILVRRISISEIDKLKNYNFSLTEGSFDASRVKEIVWVTDALAGMAGRIVVETGGSLVFPEHPDYSYAIDANKYSVTVKNNTSGRRYFYTTNTSYVIKSVWVPANGKVAAIEYVTDAGQTEFSFIHLESGGTLAKSNTSFALLYDANTYRTSVLDLLSRAVFDVGQCTAYGCIKADDVSPDGKTIVAQYSHSRTRQYETHFINMASGERLISGTQITGIKFLEDGNVTGVRPAGATLQLSPTDGSLLENVLVDLKNKKFVPQSYIFMGKTDALNYQNKFYIHRSYYAFYIFDAVNGLDKMSLVKGGVNFEGAPTSGQMPVSIDYFGAQLTALPGREAIFGVSYTYENSGKKTLKSMILLPASTKPLVLDGKIVELTVNYAAVQTINSAGNAETVYVYFSNNDGWTPVTGNSSFFYKLSEDKKSVTIKDRTGLQWSYSSYANTIKSVSVPANGKFAQIETVAADGKLEVVTFHFQTGAYGTKLAPSNSGFAFISITSGITTTYVLDLSTGAVYKVGDCSAYSCYEPADVSPDGKTIVAQYSHRGTRQYETHFINMASGERLISGTQITGIKFLEDGNVTGVRPAGATLQLSPTDGSLLENVLVDLKNKKFVPQSYIFKGQTDALNYQNKFLLVRGLSVYHIFDAVNGLDKMSLVKSGVKFEGAPTVGQTPTDIAAFSAELTSKTGRIAVFGVSYTYVNGTKKTLKTMILDPRKSAPAVLDGTIRRVINTGSRIIYILSTGRIFTVTI